MSQSVNSMNSVSSKSVEKKETNNQKLNRYQKQNGMLFSLNTTLERYQAYKLKEKLTCLVSQNKRAQMYQMLRRVKKPSSHWKLIIESICSLIDHLVYYSSVYDIVQLKQINQILERITDKLSNGEKYKQIELEFESRMKDICHEWQKQNISATEKNKILQKSESLKIDMKSKLEEIQTKNINMLQIPEYLQLISSKRLKQSQKCEQMMMIKLDEAKSIISDYINSMKKNTEKLEEYIKMQTIKQISNYKSNVFESNQIQIQTQNLFNKQLLKNKPSSILKNTKIHNPKIVTFGNLQNQNNRIQTKSKPMSYSLQIFPEYQLPFQMHSVQIQNSISQSKSSKYQQNTQELIVPKKVTEVQSQNSHKKQMTWQNKFKTQKVINQLTQIQQGEIQNENDNNYYKQGTFLKKKSKKQSPVENKKQDQKVQKQTINQNYNQNQEQSQNDIDIEKDDYINIKQRPSIQNLHIQYCKKHNLSTYYSRKNTKEFELYGMNSLSNDQTEIKRFISLFLTELQFLKQQGQTECTFKIFIQNNHQQHQQILTILDQGKKVIIIGQTTVISLIKVKSAHQSFINLQTTNCPENTQFEEEFKKVCKYPIRYHRQQQKNNSKKSPIMITQGRVLYFLRQQLILIEQSIVDWTIVFQRLIQSFLNDLISK